MLALISILVLFAGLWGLLRIYREEIENFMPGWKTKIWNGLLIAGGSITYVLDYVFDYLKTVDWASLGMQSRTAALLAVGIGIVGILISLVTKRLHSVPEAG